MAVSLTITVNDASLDTIRLIGFYKFLDTFNEEYRIISNLSQEPYFCYFQLYDLLKVHCTPS